MCRTWLPVKHFYLTSLLFFRRLKITLDSEQPMLKEKRIIPSVWGGIKGFEHFLRGEYFLIVHPIIMSWFRRVELKPACILLLVVMVTFFTCPDLLPLQNQSLSSVKEPYCCLITHQSEQTCALIKFSRKKKASKLSQDHFSIAQVIVVRVFFIFHYIVCFPVHCESFCSL